MAPYTVGFGILLIALGGWGYLGAAEEHRSTTALIPAFLGLALVVLGALAFLHHLRKHVMHAAAALGLIGLIGAVGVLIARGSVEGTTSIISQVIMAVVCGIFEALCVRSFIVARRNRAGQGVSSPADV